MRVPSFITAFAQKTSPFVQRFLRLVRARAVVGGLEVSNATLQFAYFDHSRWNMAAVRLPPGTLEAGKIKNKEQFLAGLQALRGEILKKKSKEQINVIVSLSSVNIYSQMFNLPLMEGEGLEKAVALNMQMIAPAEISQLYAGSQVLAVNAATSTMEILGAFISKELIDSYLQAFEATSFFPVAVESKGLSLVRLIRTWGAGFDPHKPYIIMAVGNRGMNFLIVRRAQLNFEYFISWADIQAGKQQITFDVFKASLTRSMNQVLNFYQQHWSEPITDMIVSTANFYPQIEKAITESFAIKVHEAQFTVNPPLSPDWHVALGSGLRGLISPHKDAEVSLLGLDARERFHRFQLVLFLRFWRLFFATAFGVLLISFVATWLFLRQTSATLEETLVRDPSSVQVKELGEFEDRARRFNATVAMVATAEKSITLKTPFVRKISDLASQNQVNIDHLTFNGFETTVTLLAQTKVYDQILKFKKALETDGSFKDVKLPINQISTTPEGTSFYMTFLIDSAAVPKL